MMRGLATLLVTLPLVSVSVVQKFVREPPDQTAAEGEHVTLPCRVDNKGARVAVEDAMVEVTGKGKRIGGDVRKCMAGIKCK